MLTRAAIALSVAVMPSLVLAQTPASAPAQAPQPTKPAAQVAAPAQEPGAAKAPEPIRLPASPRGTAAIQVGGSWGPAAQGTGQRYTGGKWVVVDYGRPNLRGRQNIFGAGAEYGKQVTGGSPLWRAGANQTTRLTTEAALEFGGTTVQPGTYSVFVDLKEGAWTLVLSSQPHQEKYDANDKSATWGADNHDPKFDVVRVPMKVETIPHSIEQFTIGFMNMTADGGELAMWWDKTMATVGFKLAK
jgi:hypothetical protein